MVLQFKTICLLACLKNGLIIQKPFTYLLARKMVKTIYLLACLKNGLQFKKNHLLTCFLIHCLFLENGLQIKTMKYQCKTVYNNNNTLVFGK